MKGNFFIPEDAQIIRVLNVTAANAGTVDYIHDALFTDVFFVVSHSGTNDTDLTLVLTEATSAAAGSASTVTATSEYWVDSDHGTTSDALVRQTDAASFVIDPATQGSALMVIHWDPAKHTGAKDWITITPSGGHASNYWFVLALGIPRYAQATPPTAIA